ncbi:MAG: hypothetical protein HY928_00615 [Elusimicrobia bacterium]|nr:hypothetical protein [Elusimicrobiota bacterium]
MILRRHVIASLFGPSFPWGSMLEVPWFQDGAPPEPAPHDEPESGYRS